MSLCFNQNRKCDILNHKDVLLNFCLKPMGSVTCKRCDQNLMLCFIQSAEVGTDPELNLRKMDMDDTSQGNVHNVHH